MIAITILISACVVLFFMNTESYIDKHGGLPSFRMLFRLHVPKIHLRVFYFFAWLAILLAVIAAYWIYVTPAVDMLVSLITTGDFLLKILFVAIVAADYLVRFAILKRIYSENERKGIKEYGRNHIWDARSLTYDKVNDNEKPLLILVDTVFVIFVLLLIFIHIYKSLN